MQSTCNSQAAFQHASDSAFMLADLFSVSTFQGRITPSYAVLCRSTSQEEHGCIPTVLLALPFFHFHLFHLNIEIAIYSAIDCLHRPLPRMKWCLSHITMETRMRYLCKAKLPGIAKMLQGNFKCRINFYLMRLRACPLTFHTDNKTRFLCSSIICGRVTKNVTSEKMGHHIRP